MSVDDPYPDLPDAAAGTGASEAPGERPELDEADSRLLDALSRPQPAVVHAVEDDLRRPASAPSPAPPRRTSGSLAPVFQAPDD